MVWVVVIVSGRVVLVWVNVVVGCRKCSGGLVLVWVVSIVVVCVCRQECVSCVRSRVLTL